MMAFVAEIYAFPLDFYRIKPPLSYMVFCTLAKFSSLIFAEINSAERPSISNLLTSQYCLREWLPQRMTLRKCDGLQLNSLEALMHAGLPVRGSGCSPNG